MESYAADTSAYMTWRGLLVALLVSRMVYHDSRASSAERPLTPPCWRSLKRLWCDGAEFGDAGGENSSQEFVAYFREGYGAELVREGGVCLFSYWEQRGVFVEGGDILE